MDEEGWFSCLYFGFVVFCEMQKHPQGGSLNLSHLTSHDFASSFPDTLSSASVYLCSLHHLLCSVLTFPPGRWGAFPLLHLPSLASLSSASFLWLVQGSYQSCDMHVLPPSKWVLSPKTRNGFSCECAHSGQRFLSCRPGTTAYPG